MATIVFGAVGTAIGGPIGSTIGAFMGRQVDTLLLGTSRHGPRLRELEASLSTYGLAIPQVYGRMRVPGLVIWATELQEHSELQGSKGQPAVTAYSYTANLAVALSSRPIAALGRIWADGKLLRGSAGDLKVGGTLRVHLGGEDQEPDPLIAASEGEARCPAFRGLAYVVFEGLALADFGNRVPTLTFEVFAEDAVCLSDMLRTLPDAEASGSLDDLAGLLVEDSLADSFAALAPVLPIALNGAGATLDVRAPGSDLTPVLLGEPAVSGDDDAFARAEGISYRRAPSDPQPPAVLRFLDVDRDYQPGTQHAAGRPGSGQPDMVELPTALQADKARRLVEQMTRLREGGRERLAWRTCMLDATIAPGTLVRLPGRPGTWQVDSWEWRETGIELELVRMETAVVSSASVMPPERFPAPLDAPVAATRLVAFELPEDGAAAARDAPRIAAAVGATSANWSGASLFLDRGDGLLTGLGPAGRKPAVVGTVIETLQAASPLLLDRSSSVVVELASPDQALVSASLADLAAGTNLALIGEELVQFARAEPLGAGRWRLSHWLRGRGGTEAAVVSHESNEPFALVDARLTVIDSAPVPNATLLALGRGDVEPASAMLRLTGIGSRPFAPVHPRAEYLSDGGVRLRWTRRARGGWDWADGVDVPLVEEVERYVVTLEAGGQTVRSWTVSEPAIGFTAPERAEFAVLAPTGELLVRQQGTRALSAPLRLPR